MRSVHPRLAVEQHDICCKCAVSACNLVFAVGKSGKRLSAPVDATDLHFNNGSRVPGIDFLINGIRLALPRISVVLFPLLILIYVFGVGVCYCGNFIVLELAT